MDLKLLSDTPPWEWPKNAASIFAKLLRDRRANPSDRLIAADLAGDFTVINDHLAHILLAVLRDGSESEELRAKVAISFGAALDAAYTEWDEELGAFDDDEMVPIGRETFLEIRQSLQTLYADTSIPKLVRRRILEAAVRAREPWQDNAIREAYASGDRDWILTAVFAMRFVPGFEKETLESLKSTDTEIQREAVLAAGEHELDAAWGHVSKLAQDRRTEKDLRIAAIGASGAIRPKEAQEFLFDLADSEDEDIAEAADDALSMIIEPEDDEEDEDEEDFDEDEDDDEEDDEDDEDDEEDEEDEELF
jgi:hypothetical protein